MGHFKIEKFRGWGTAPARLLLGYSCDVSRSVRFQRVPPTDNVRTVPAFPLVNNDYFTSN